jgi:hypothetical protein
MDNTAKAREQFELVVRGPATEYNDPRYQQDAEQRLRDLR